MIGKEQFVSLIEALEEQYRKDIAYKNALSDALNTDCGLYDNATLFNAIINLLRCSFPIKENHCEIEFYCYYQNFGRVETEDEVIVETAEDLYERLISEHKTSAKTVNEAYK